MKRPIISPTLAPFEARELLGKLRESILDLHYSDQLATELALDMTHLPTSLRTSC
jgi:hypothetical protein